MQWKERLDVEVSQTVEKYRLIPYKINELLQFACIWASFDVGGRRVLRSARLMHGGERLHVEISQTGEKYRLIF